MRAVNLLPKEESGEGRGGPALPVVVACVGLVLIAALLAFMYMSGSKKVGQQRKALAQVTAAYDAIPAPPPPPAIDKQLPQQREARVAALATVLGQRVVWDRVLREVSQVVPTDVWLVTLTAQSPTYLGGGAAASTATTGQLPSGFIVEGCTYSQDSVARFLSRLQLVPDLSEMTLAKSESAGGGSGSSGDTSASSTSCPAGMFTFTLQGNVRTGGSSS